MVSLCQIAAVSARMRFELHRGELAQGVLASAAVVGALDPGDDRKAQFGPGRQRWRSRTFFCRRAKNDSIAALSPAAPARSIEPITPLFFRVRT